MLRYELGSKTLADCGENLGKVNERNNDRTDAIESPSGLAGIDSSRVLKRRVVK